MKMKMILPLASLILLLIVVNSCVPEKKATPPQQETPKVTAASNFGADWHNNWENLLVQSGKERKLTGLSGIVQRSGTR